MLIGGIAKVVFEKFPIFEFVKSEVSGIRILSGTEGLLMSVTPLNPEVRVWWR